MSISLEELKRHPWPKPNFPIGQEVLDQTTADDPRGIPDDNGVPLIPRPGYTYSGKTWPQDYMSSCFIPPEHVTCIPLPLPAGSSAVRQILYHQNILHGVTTGEKSFYFRYGEDGFQTHELPCRAVCLSLNDAHPRILLADGSLCTPEGSRHAALPVSPLNAVSDGFRIAGQLEDGRLFMLQPDSGACQTGPAPEKPLSGALTTGKTGLYGCLANGTLIRWDGENIRHLRKGLPSFAGRRVYNQLSALVLSPDETSLWGGTSEDGLLFEYDLTANILRSYGKPLYGRGISCLHHTGTHLHGIGGEGCCHLFSRSQQNGSLQDDGMISVSEPRSWIVYEGHCLTSDPEGNLWFGESDRISHLFRIAPGFQGEHQE